MQGLGWSDADRTGGSSVAVFVDHVFGRADSFLFGRRTYESETSYPVVIGRGARPGQGGCAPERRGPGVAATAI